VGFYKPFNIDKTSSSVVALASFNSMSSEKEGAEAA
jgi:hypothetical protein